MEESFWGRWRHCWQLVGTHRGLRSMVWIHNGSTEGLVIGINLNKDSLNICSAFVDQRGRKLHGDWTGKEDLGGSPQPLH